MVALICAGCGSSKETTGTSSDDDAVTEPAAMTAGREAESPANTDGGAKPGDGSGGARSGDAPAAGSASESAADSGNPPIEKATKFDAGSDPARNKVSAAQLCERLAAINCAGEAYCCDAPNRTVEACQQDLIKTCSDTLMLDKIAMQESSRFDAEAAEKAYTELENRASKCDTSVAQWGGSIDGLRGILRGSVAPKASCMPAATIDPVQVGAALVSCAEPETHACVYATLLDPWTCEPRSMEGGVCVTDNNCVDGLYCLVNTPGIAGKCTPRKAVGDACASPTECASLFCKKSKCVEADQQAAYCLIN